MTEKRILTKPDEGETLPEFTERVRAALGLPPKPATDNNESQRRGVTDLELRPARGKM